MDETITDLMEAVKQFRDDRDWKRFHAPKNLSMAIAIEAAELMEHFQWMDCDESARHAELRKEEVSMELADVMIYCLNLADVMGVDPEAVILRKLELNGEKYPLR